MHDDFVGRQLALWASGSEELFAQKGNLLVLDNWTALFLSPVNVKEPSCIKLVCFLNGLCVRLGQCYVLLQH